MTDHVPELLPNERDRIARIIYDAELARENKPPIPDGSWEKIKPLARFHFAAADAILTRPTPSERPVAQVREADIVAGAKAVAMARGHDPDAFAPLTAMCTGDNQQVPWWMVFEEEAEACLKAALTSERPSESAVAWRNKVFEVIEERLRELAEANALFGKDQRLDAPAKVDRNNREISWLKDLRSMLRVRAIPHGDAVRESTETSDEYTKLADEVQEMIETDDMAESDVAKAKLTLTALREAASRPASERVSERTGEQ